MLYLELAPFYISFSFNAHHESFFHICYTEGLMERWIAIYSLDTVSQLD